MATDVLSLDVGREVVVLAFAIARKRLRPIAAGFRPARFFFLSVNMNFFGDSA